MGYVGYATINGAAEESQHIIQAQNNSQTFTLQFDAAQLGKPCPSAPTVTDVDGNVYNTVQIGNQCWMRENLHAKHYANGDPIAEGSGGNSSSTNPLYYDYSYSGLGLTLAERGYLYNWPAVMHGASSSNTNPSNVQGICPIGWHVPSDAEWTQLKDYVSSQSQYVCGSTSTYIAKSLASTTGWASTSTNTCAVGNAPSSNNATGFGALSAGSYYGSYGNFGNYAYFWSSTKYTSTSAYNHWLYYDGAGVRRYSNNNYFAFSVRCIKD